MKIELKRELCVGAGSCVEVAPAVFQLDDEEKVVLVDPHGADEQTIYTAAESCPVFAIVLRDEQTDHTLYP